MTLSPGDTIQMILTVGGVPYAKTLAVTTTCERRDIFEEANAALFDLIRDIDLYANESPTEGAP